MSPESIISKSSTEPSYTDSTVATLLIDCLKSYAIYSESELYGNVFLIKFELLKSNDCDKVLFSLINFDLYSSPTKYGKLPTILLLSSIVEVAK